jgi:hypothetical protein
VALGYSKIFRSGLSLSGGAGVNFLGVTTTPRYAAAPVGACAEYVTCGLDVFARLIEVAGGQAPLGRFEGFQQSVGPALEVRLMVGYAF